MNEHLRRLAGALSAAALAIIVVMPGCEGGGGDDGASGAPCVCQSDCDDFLRASYGCAAGFVCQEPRLVCVPVHSLHAGDPCSTDDACAADLFCGSLRCEAKQTEGSPCGADSNCVDGLACLKVCGAPRCLAPGMPCPASDAGADGDADDAASARDGDFADAPGGEAQAQAK